MSLSGMCVALSAALVYDKKTVVLSILGTYFNGIILESRSTTFRIIVMTDSGSGIKLDSTMPRPEILLTDA